MLKTEPLCTDAESNLTDRILGEIEKNSFIALPGKGGYSGLILLITVCPNLGEFGEEFYNNGSRAELLIRIRVELKQKELQICSLWKENHIHRKIHKTKRQRTLYQIKKQDKTPEKQLNEVEIGNLPEKEFRIMIVKMIQDLGKIMEAKIEKTQEMFNKDRDELKNKQR